MKTIKTKSRIGRPPDAELPGRRMEEILAAATELFATSGFAAADTQTLADNLGMGKGTIYRYFSSKEELFLATVDRAMLQLNEEVEKATATIDETDVLARASSGIRAYLGFFDRHPHIVELLIQERAQFKDRRKPTYFQHQDANIGKWQVSFQRLIQAGKVRDVEPEKITNVLSNLVYGTMFTNYFAGRSKSLESQSAEILDIVFNGILAAPAAPSNISPNSKNRRLKNI